MVLPLKNAVQPYSWGSSTAIPELFGIHDPSNGPMAEIWMGAHPKAPSEVTVNDQTISLDRYIAADPIGTLGVAAVDRFGETLPFLFKILAAAEPLSIQAHPSRAQARSGYSREEAAGISLAAPNRNYRDDNHKPELIYALTPFWGLRGFRSPSEIRAAFESLGVRSSGYLPMPSADDELPLFFRSLMTLSESDRAELVDSARRVAAEFWPEVDRFPDPGDTNARFYWLQVLCHKYPGDVGALAPLFLNVFSLRPGEATYQPAGVLHAYLWGTGAELMANSDNVLRGGLTSKHVDLDELLSVGVFRTEEPCVLSGRPAGGDPATDGNPAAGGRVALVPGPDPCATTDYPAPFDEFEFSRLEFDGECSIPTGAPQILFCSTGTISLESGGERTTVGRGESVFVRADEPSLSTEGSGSLLRATVGRAR